MQNMVFIDTEVSDDNNRNKILDYGAVKQNGEILHSASAADFAAFIREADYLCGHNIVHHDLCYLQEGMEAREITICGNTNQVVDTLYWSALLFPQRPYHALLKDDKLQTDELNNPLNDAKKAMDLFYSELGAFRSLPEPLKRIYYGLLREQAEFQGFFHVVNAEGSSWADGNGSGLEAEIRAYFYNQFCEHADLLPLIQNNPIELAYCLALIAASDEYSITPRWIVKQYPKVDLCMNRLCGTPCRWICPYCQDKLDARKGLKRFFGYDSYREYDGLPLQEQAVELAIAQKSLLAIFPTGGGKSITFQVPALMAGRNTKGLTVVISPLQSLMKDQVDHLEQSQITDAVTINGLLDPIERAESFRRVESGEAMLLYISPESLRSRSIERLLLGRRINRFVIDEAHCFSAWGQDFRVDYLYIADFIRNLCEKKNLDSMIPVSCFTATAKQNVIEDICSYFKEHLNLELPVLSASSTRHNLRYQVIPREENEKYEAVRTLLTYKQCPTIIYVSRTKKASELAGKLNADGYQARAYHGRMDKKEKSENQDAFIRGEVGVMVATSAFGMGVDKKDVGMVIHYDISDSLENYVQEAGRAGRDQGLFAECFILFNDEDLNKHFLLLNQTKISMQEIQQVWKAIKDATRSRARLSNSALEIARRAGWDDNAAAMETRVKTAIAALEDAGYVKRKENMPQVFADSIQAKSVMEAIDKINRSDRFQEKEAGQAIRIVKKLISSRSRQNSKEEMPESRVDYISDDLGIPKEEVIRIIQLLREANVLADAKDLTAYLEENGSLSKAVGILQNYRELENFLFEQIPEGEEVIHLKELNEQAQAAGLKKANVDQIKTILNYWVIKGYMKRERLTYSRNLMKIAWQQERQWIHNALARRIHLSDFILRYLSVNNASAAESGTIQEGMLQFSILELMDAYQEDSRLLGFTASANEMENALFYLSRIGALKLEGGFLITYNALSIERVERDNKIRYKLEDYKKLKQYYEQKTQMIHIVGEYAQKMMEDYQSALVFVDDYFKLEYSSFLQKYFPGSKREELLRNLTPEKFQRVFGELSPTQLKIINDKQSQYIVVAAGPGSGKTRILVHKLASLLMMEDVKHEQLLMVTFSRAAATEFKKRLLDLIGNAANYVEIKTFHSYCFDLLGRMGSLEKSSQIIQKAIAGIRSKEVEASRITKMVLVIDEAQDMDENEYQLIQALIEQNNAMRVIAVGDDDQNIYAFRGSDSGYMRKLASLQNSALYELTQNYRSRANLVALSNQYVQTLHHRLKCDPIVPVTGENGRIRVIRYGCSDLVIPVIQKVLEEGISGSTGILTNTNGDALKIAALLKKNGIRVRLVDLEENYHLYYLVEIRYFLKELYLSEDSYIIPKENWDRAKQTLKSKYADSRDLAVCEQLLLDYESTNPMMYRSDLLTFLYDSREEDFCQSSHSIVCISTIHKAKGREFDSVILVLNQCYPKSEEAKRQLYVGMTRAKKRLDIHYNTGSMDVFREQCEGSIEELICVTDAVRYPESNLLIIQLGYPDVYLSYFKSTQRAVEPLMAGMELTMDEAGCYDQFGRKVLWFSGKFKQKMDQLKQDGYYPERAGVHHVLYWREEGAEQEIRIVLPEVEFRKGTKRRE